MRIYLPIQFTGPGSPIWTGPPSHTTIGSIYYFVTPPDSKGHQYMKFNGVQRELRSQADYDLLNKHLKAMGVIR